MVKQEYIDQLVGVQGYTVVALHFGEGRGSGEKELVVEIERLEARYRCRCGAEFETYYDGTMRMVRDLPYGPYKRSWLCFHQVRVDCCFSSSKIPCFQQIEFPIVSKGISLFSSSRGIILSGP